MSAFGADMPPLPPHLPFLQLRQGDWKMTNRISQTAYMFAIVPFLAAGCRISEVGGANDQQPIWEGKVIGDWAARLQDPDPYVRAGAAYRLGDAGIPPDEYIPKIRARQDRVGPHCIFTLRAV
jgi:hypothetical protein